MMGVLNDNISGINDADLRFMMNKVRDKSIAYNAGKLIMTDDNAPVELLGMKVIDKIIRDEVAYYKEIFDKNGVQGVIDAL